MYAVNMRRTSVEVSNAAAFGVGVWSASTKQSLSNFPLRKMSTVSIADEKTQALSGNGKEGYGKVCFNQKIDFNFALQIRFQYLICRSSTPT